MELVIGSYSEPNDAGIHVYQWDSVEGFTNTTNIVGIENPSYLDIEHHARLIYAITEKKDGGVAELHIYQIQAEGAPANHLRCIPFPGAGSCYISTDKDKKHAFITNYGDGTLTVIKLPNEMSSGSVVQHLQFLGNGPNEERQDKPHTHAARLSKDEKYLYCSDLGSDRLYRFAYFPEANLPLQAETPPYISLPPGSGPRHFTFSPNGRWLYLITELSGEIFLFDTENLTESWQNRISLLQNGYQGTFRYTQMDASSMHLIGAKLMRLSYSM
jgi:6-phosphogluconolactonase